MSTFRGIIPQFSYNLSLISHVFINFNEKFNLIVCILDHLVLFCIKLDRLGYIAAVVLIIL